MKKNLETQIQTNAANTQDSCNDKDSEIFRSRQLIKEKEKNINELKPSVEYLSDILNKTYNDNGIIMVFDEDSKRYSPIKLTCYSTVLSMNLQSHNLAQSQLCEAFSKENNTYETSKFGKKYIG